jgi:hypothetical protein
LVANNEASGGSGLLTAVPEPTGIVLAAFGLLSLLATCRRNRRIVNCGAMIDAFPRPC